jgi:hypothetical protein
MKRRLLFPTSILGLLTVAAFGSGACSSKSTDPTPGDGTVKVAEGVVSLDAAHADDVTVAVGKLSFPKSTHPEIASLVAGNVLVGEAGTSPTTPNPWGFLRKVVSVSDDGAGNSVVTTTQATILDLVDEGEFSGTLTIPADGSAATASVKGLRPKGGPITLIDLTGKKLLDETLTANISGKSVGFQAVATLTKGSLQFTPNFDVGAKIKPALTLDIKKLISEAHVIANGSLDAVAEIDASLKLVNPGTLTGADIAALIANKLTKSSTTSLVDKDIPLPGLKLGPISVPAHAHFNASVVCDFKWGGETRVVVGAKGNVTVSAGAKWDGSTVQPVWSHTESLDITGPTWTITDDILLKCSVIPHFEVSLWDVAAGEVTASAYASLSAQATCNTSTLTGDVAGQAFAGANATAKASLNVFGLYKWEKECTLFDVHTPVASVSGSFPLGKGATCTPAPAPTVPAPITDPGPSCFGGASTPADDAGVSETGSTGGDAGTLPDGAPIMCSHDVCTKGELLTEGCKQDNQDGACIAAICKNDPYCCTSSWSLSCVQIVIDGKYGCTPRTCP